MTAQTPCPPDLVVPADDGVQFAVACSDGEVTPIPGQGFIFALWVLVHHPVAAPHLRTPSKTAHYLENCTAGTWLQSCPPDPDPPAYCCVAPARQIAGCLVKRYGLLMHKTRSSCTEQIAQIWLGSGSFSADSGGASGTIDRPRLLHGLLEVGLVKTLASHAVGAEAVVIQVRQQQMLQRNGTRRPLIRRDENPDADMQRNTL